MAGRARTAQERREAAEARRARRAAVTDPDVVMAAAAAFLAVRSRSSEETRRRLRHLGYPHGLCDQVVERLEQLGYLDDHEFARAWVESRDRARPRGAVALRRELQQKGVSDAIIAAVLEGRRAGDGRGHAPDGSDADREAARKLLSKRARSLAREPDAYRRRQRAYALLARNGFAPDVCQEVAAALADDLPS